MYKRSFSLSQRGLPLLSSSSRNLSRHPARLSSTIRATSIFYHTTPAIIPRRCRATHLLSSLTRNNSPSFLPRQRQYSNDYNRGGGGGYNNNNNNNYYNNTSSWWSNFQYRPWPVYVLIAANVAISGYYLLLGPENASIRRFYSSHMVLSNTRFKQKPYTLLTYAFTQLDLLHLGMNMFTLYSFGNIAHQMLGSSKFLGLYVASAIGGGAAHLLYSSQVPRSNLAASRVVRYDDAAVGSSAAIAGIMSYYIARVPQGTTILLIIPVKNWIFLPLFLGGSAFMAVTGNDKSWAHAGHLGGGLVGIAYALARSALRR